MAAYKDDLDTVADQLKGLLTRIEEEDVRRGEEEDSAPGVRTGADREILPEGVEIEEGTRIDRYCILSTDKELIYAVLTILPDRPESYELPVNRILAEMKQMGIQFGIRKANVEKAVQLCRSDRRSRIDLIVAQGQRPVHGTDTVLTFHWSRGPGRPVVEKGDLLVEKHPGKLWRDGCNILGHVLPARRGDEMRIVPGPGVVCSEDGLQVYAACSGIVRWDDGHIWVEPEDRDGYLTCETSPDLLTATMSLYPPSGKGVALAVNEVIRILFKHGITYGIRRATITNAVNRVKETREPVVDVRVAEGQPPGKGEDGRVEILVDHTSKVDRYWINADGTVDFFKLRQIDSVQEGQVLARIVPPTTGSEGRTVTGERLPGIEGKPAEGISLGDNVELSPDGSEVVSCITGQVHIEEGTISVQPVHVVDGDIDFSTGNLHFVGDLVIRGNVLDAFEVRAGGNITVEGTVGSSVVRAGGNINIGRGVFGKQRGLVRADGDVTAAFLQNATVFAKGDVLVGNQILNSRVYARGKVMVKSGKGTVVGGRVQGGKGVEAKVIGSAFGTRTEVISGLDWEMEENLARLRHQIERLQENMDKLDLITQQFLQLLDREVDELTSEERQLTSAAIAKRKSMERELLRLETEQREIRARILFPQPGSIIATNILHADARCTIWDAKMRVRRPERCARVTYDRVAGHLTISRHIA